MHFQSSSKSRRYLFLQGAALVLLLALFGFQLLGGKIHSEVPFETVQAKLTETLDSAVYPEVSASKIRRYINLNPDEFENAAMYRVDDAMSASELVLVRFSTPEQAQKFEEAVESRISTQHDIYSGYAPEQAGLMENALVDVQDNYALYYTGDHPEQIQSTFELALKEG